MSITTYKATLIFGGFPYDQGSEAEEFFIRLRDAAMSCGYSLQGIDLDCHFEKCRISQSPQSGWDFGDNDKIHVEDLDEAIKRDKENEEMWNHVNDSISEEHAKSEQTRIDPHGTADDPQPVG